MWQYPNIPFQVYERDNKKILFVTHNAGFFSCCTVKLHQIIRFFNEFKKLPDIVDSSNQFNFFKPEQMDLTNVFFQNKTETFEYEKFIIGTNPDGELQFSDYSKLLLDDLNPFIDKYFSFSDNVKQAIQYLENKYKLDYDNLCSVYFRGLDKRNETDLGDYDNYINKCKSILKDHPNIRFLVQTDEIEFLQAFMTEFPNSIHFEELPKLPRQNTSMTDNIRPDQKINFALVFVASVFLVSKCKIMVTHSGNCALWSVFFRNNMDNVYQYITEYKHEKKNTEYWNK